MGVRVITGVGLGGRGVAVGLGVKEEVKLGREVAVRLGWTVDVALMPGSVRLGTACGAAPRQPARTARHPRKASKNVSCFLISIWA